MGKTRISLCYVRYKQFNNVVIFVPANVLLEQWKESIKFILPNYNIVIFTPSNKNIDETKNKTIYIYHYGNYKYFSNNYTYDYIMFDEVHYITSINLIEKE